MLLAGPIYYWSRLVYVPSRLLAASTDLALRLLGVKQLPKAATSQQEVELIIRQGAADGVFEPAEQALILGSHRSDYFTEAACWPSGQKISGGGVSLVLYAALAGLMLICHISQPAAAPPESAP